MSVDALKFLEERNGGPLTFGQVLKSWRMAEEWKQEDLAKKVGITKMAISKLETGKMMPAPKTLKRIAKVFNVDVEMFLPYVLQDTASMYGDYKVEIKPMKAG